MEAVLVESVGARLVLGEELAEPVRSPERRGLEDVEVRVLGEQLVDAGPIAAIQG
jgi:hypothetical protein